MKQELTSTAKTFISNLVDKNYKSANTDLQKLVELKLTERIRSTVAQKNNQEKNK
jgi:hypothetical protein